MIKLSGYKILKKIGSGGMGDVYLAEHEVLETTVAIKSLHTNLVGDDSFRKRFRTEAKVHAKLDHPNVVKLLDYKERKDGLFLIMEYVDGKQLDEHIKKVTGPIPEKELTALFYQVLDAIGYAHKKGLVHRDIKPSNIMIDKEGSIKVLDFGIAKMQEEEKGLTKTGIQIGTAAYMSPEQVDAKKLDTLSDIYSLGVTLFYMAVGKSPYSDDTNSFRIQEKIMREPFPTASDIYPGVSNIIEKIINKATEKNKEDRYQSCKDFKDDFYHSKLNSDLKISNDPLSEKEKEVSKSPKSKLQIIILLILTFLLIGSFLIINPRYIPFSNSNELTKKEFREFLKNYYNTIEEKNLKDFDKFYCITVNKWFNKNNISLTDIIIESTDYFNKYSNQKHLIKWNTFEINKIDDKYLLSYNLFYKFRKDENDDWQKFDLGINMILNDQMKIYSLQETKRKKIKDEKDNIITKEIIKEEEKVYPSKTTDINKDLYNEYWRIANNYSNDGDYDRAMKYLNLALEIDLDKIDASYVLQRRGALKKTIKNYTGAISDFSKALKLYPSYTMLYQSRAEVKQLSNDLIGACEDWELASRLDPSSYGTGESSRVSINKYCNTIDSVPISFVSWAQNISLLTVSEIYRKRFNKDPDHGEYLDLKSSYFTPEILYGRTSEVFDDYSNKRYGKLNEGLAYTDKRIISSSNFIDFLHRSKVKFYLGDYSGSLSDINQAIDLAKLEKSRNDNEYWINGFNNRKAIILFMLNNNNN